MERTKGSERDQGHDIGLETGLLGPSIGQVDSAQGFTPEARAALVEEVASLKQKLEAKNTELRKIQSDKESLQAKLDEGRERGRSEGG